MIILTDFMTPLCCQNLIKKHIIRRGIHHCTGVNDCTRCKESWIKPVVPNKHVQPRNCCRLSCKCLTCGSGLKIDYKMHCGFLLCLCDTMLNLLSLYIKSFFFPTGMLANIRTQFSFLLTYCKSKDYPDSALPHWQLCKLAGFTSYRSKNCCSFWTWN